MRTCVAACAHVRGIGADECSSERLKRSVQEAVEAEQLLLKSVSAPPDVLMQAARHFGSTAINVKKLATHTGSGTANQNKAAMLAHLSDELGRGTQEYIKAVNEVSFSLSLSLSLPCSMRTHTLTHTRLLSHTLSCTTHSFTYSIYTHSHTLAHTL